MRSLVRLCAVWLLPAVTAAAGAEGGKSVSAPARRPTAIRRSDVVFMYDDPRMYAAYGCSALGWAGRADPAHVVAAHAAGVRQFSCSVGFLTEFKRTIDFDPNFLDAACRNFAGEPYLVPWLWDHKHKGHGAYWWCTNSPLYRKYLHARLEEVMRSKPDGLHIDDYRGTSGSITWLAGGFCRHCLAGFREYLAGNVAKEKLAALGIADLARFDYRQFLLDRGVKPAEYNKRRSGLPLAAEFHRFHVQSATRFVADYHRRAGELAGRPVSLSLNSGLEDPQALAIAPHVDYFCCEVGHGADQRRPGTHPIYIYRLADALGRPVCSTASGQDWAFVAEQKLPGLVRTWIAMSYALGHNLMAPHRQWCYTQAKGTHWYSGPQEEYAWLYRFVRDSRRLLDDYEAVGPVLVVYDNAANRAGKGRIEPICTELAAANIPFRVVVAGDEGLPYRLPAGELAKAKAVIIPKGLALEGEQKQVLDTAAAAGRLVTWPDKLALARLIGTPIAVEGAEGIWALPRAVPGDPARPAVIHLLNRNYDAAADRMTPQKDLRLRLRRDLFAGRAFAKAVAHAPKAEPAILKIAADAESVTITVPGLDLWAIVELCPASSASAPGP